MLGFEMKTSRVRALALATVSVVALACSGSSASAQDSERQITIQQRPVLDLRAPPSSLAVQSWVNRSDATYQPGEDVVLYFRTSHDAQVLVFNVDAQGRSTQLFPNGRATDNRLRGNQLYQLPAPGAGYALKVSPPFGANVIKVIATTASTPMVPRDRMAQEGDFSTFAGDPDDLARQIQVVMTQNAQAAWATSEMPVYVVAQRPTVPPAPIAPQPGMGAGVVVGPAVAAAPAIPAPIATMPSAFGLDVRTSKTSYRIGEELSVLVTPERNCKLTLINVAPSGQATVLYPNREQQDVSLTAGRTAFLPGADGKIRLSILGPAGNQNLVAFCKEQQTLFGALFNFNDRSVYPTLGTASDLAQLVAQHVQPGAKDVARAVISFAVTP
jgi:hypothetical protein